MYKPYIDQIGASMLRDVLKSCKNLNIIDGYYVEYWGEDTWSECDSYIYYTEVMLTIEITAGDSYFGENRHRKI